MDVNSIFSGIESFWETIYPIIVFHLIFYLVYIFIFGKFSLKELLEKIVASDNFKRAKSLLTEFELWKRLPILLLLLTLIYFAIFNSLTTIVGSAGIYPFENGHSPTEFFYEYEPKQDLLTIAQYGSSPSPSLSSVEELVSTYSETYKASAPERYEEWVGWVGDSLGEWIRNLYLFEMFLLLMTGAYILKLKKSKGKRGRLTWRFLLVLFACLPVLFVMRYKVEQRTEEVFAAKILFVKSSLATDNTKRMLLSPVQVDDLRNKLRTAHVDWSYDYWWISRIVERSSFLESVLGRRRLHVYYFDE